MGGPRTAILVTLALLAAPISALGLAPVAPRAAEESLLTIVSFDGNVPAGLEALGVRTLYRFETTSAIVALASPSALEALSMHPAVLAIEEPQPIEYNLDSATIASRARDVWDAAHSPALPTLTDADGDVVDGRGVGIAIVDSGLDGLHPDFQAPGKIGGNFVVTPAGMVPSQFANEGNGHGTHVAGIAAGTGAASEGRYKGAAPGATLYSFGMGPAGSTLFPAIAFDWILAHGDEQDPPIRVVSNSWGCNSTICRVTQQDLLYQRLAVELVESGYVVLFAVGNDGGDGLVSSVNVESMLPGVLGIANYHDEDFGGRDYVISGSSSRGDARRPETWPDLAAPGSLVVSTWALGPEQSTRNPLNGANTYRTLSGTSMATPHVAGVVALMVQARPDLTAEDIAYILKSTATKLTHRTVPAYVRADATHPWDGANYDSGHGLVDAYAAVEAAKAFTSKPAAPPLEALPADYGTKRRAVVVDEWFYLDGASLASERPTQTEPTVRVVRQNERVVAEHTLTQDVTMQGYELDVWAGTFLEAPGAKVAGTFWLVLERVTPEGDVIELGRTSRPTVYGVVGMPIYRELRGQLPEPVIVPAGDTLRASIWVGTPAPANQATATWVLYEGSATTPTRLGIGHVVGGIQGETSEACSTREDCVRIGGDRNNGQMYCSNYAQRVVWYGPPGSSASFACNGAVATCSIPGEPGDAWGRCTAVSYANPQLSGYMAVCSYRTEDGSQVGEGWCEGSVEDRD